MKQSAGPWVNLRIIAATVLVGFLAFARPMEAKVVYTPVNVTLSGNGYLTLDLNHDRINDFTILAASQVTACGTLRHRLLGSAKISPTTHNGIVVSNSDIAALLQSGIDINSSQSFYKGQTVITQFSFCYGYYRVDGYLGLEFQINGQIHYGWAQVFVNAHSNWMRTTVVGFAYETIPGQAIKTGQTSGAFDEPTANADSGREDSGPNASVTTPISDAPQLRSLAIFALGAQGVPLSRRRESVGEHIL
jgi:hypothetical protein